MVEAGTLLPAMPRTSWPHSPQQELWSLGWEGCTALLCGACRDRASLRIPTPALRLGFISNLSIWVFKVLNPGFNWKLLDCAQRCLDRFEIPGKPQYWYFLNTVSKTHWNINRWNILKGQHLFVILSVKTLAKGSLVELQQSHKCSSQFKASAF